MRNRMVTIRTIGCVLISLCLPVVTLAAGQDPMMKDSQLAKMESEPSRFYVKYHQGKQQPVRELLQTKQLEVLDSIEDLQVLVVAGPEDKLKQLEANDLIDYVEPEPTRQLYSQ
ncbi:ATPase [Vibrio tetraodonis]|uniref:ATPase n=1 Tax=Vibrio tetraodonis TaxID=2231647 RepID=UPI000E0B30F7|nr:ATPase [Vibrio tetraodonis]